MQRQFETENYTRQQDIEELVQNSVFAYFKNKTVLITGATGFIGSECVLSFLCANRLKNNNTKVVALIRNADKAKRIFKNILDDDNLEIIIQDILEPVKYEKKVDFIIHCASNTQSKDMLEYPERTSSIITRGTKNILDFSLKNKIQSAIFLSSLEVYGQINSDVEVKEDDEFGQIDENNPRSSYPLAKRKAEELCIDYANKFGIDIKIARLTQIIGAGIDYNDNRVFVQFARAVVEKKDIILHTKGETTRNYCYITDCVSAILTVLIFGKNSEIYNIANTETKCSIKELAEKFAKISDVQIAYEMTDHREYLPLIKLCLNNAKLKNLGWECKINFNEMLERLINGIIR